MANWLSSKLKVAESLLHQIDQQAAESLKKNEKSRQESVFDDGPRTSINFPPLKDQLQKKVVEKDARVSVKSPDLQIRSKEERVAKDEAYLNNVSSVVLGSGDWTELLGSPTSVSPSSQKGGSSDSHASNGSKRNKVPVSKPSVASSNSSVKNLQSNSAIPVVKRSPIRDSVSSRSGRGFNNHDEKKSQGTTFDSASSKKDNEFNLGDGASSKLDRTAVGSGNVSSEKVELLDGSQRKAQGSSQRNGGHLTGFEKVHESDDEKYSHRRANYMLQESHALESDASVDYTLDRTSISEVSDTTLSNEGVDSQVKIVSSSTNALDDFLSQELGINGNGFEFAPLVKQFEHVENDNSGAEILRDNEHAPLSETISANRGHHESQTNLMNLQAAQRDLENLHLTSIELDRDQDTISEPENESASETDTASTSDSGSSTSSTRERRRRREQMMAEAEAARVVAAIREHENQVARLEGEMKSLEKILEEREMQQIQEASEMQTNTTEVMEAVDLEKQKHNSTRMEIMTRLAKLETTNADLSRAVAATQWKLQEEAVCVIELRQKVDLRKASQEELRRQISTIQQNFSPCNESKDSRRLVIKPEILEAEYAVTCDKIEKLQEKTRKLEENIEVTRKTVDIATEVEIELKKRLSHFADQLIHKQAQVEALSSEKASLMFRLERLEEQGNGWSHTIGADDLEVGMFGKSAAKAFPLSREAMQSGKDHLASIIHQLDAIFSTGLVLLRRNSTARVCVSIYLLCLHLLVMYILFSRSRNLGDDKFGAVISIESLNKTA